MFCVRCGSRIDETETVCPVCGKKTDEAGAAAPEAEPAPKHAEKTPTVAVSDDTLPENYDYREPDPPAAALFPQRRKEEYYPELPRQSYDSAPVRQEPAKRKKTHRGVIAVIIISALVALTAGGFLAFTLVRQNSPESRISMAEDDIINGKLNSALSRIEDISTPEADSVREYVEMCRDRDNFARAYDPSSLVDNRETDELCDRLYVSVRRLRDEGFDKNLPDRLYSMYNTAYERLSQLKSCIGSLKDNVFYDAQYCVYQFKLRKNGESFTMAKLESYINVSEPAVESIKRNIIDDKMFAEMTASGKSQAIATLNEFYTVTSAQVAQDRFDLDSYRATQSESAKLTLNDTDKNYRATVGTGLNALDSTSDMKTNADLLLNNLRYAWTAYALQL